MCSDSLHHAGSSKTHVIPAMIFDRFSDSWHCQQMMYSFDFLVPAKISGRIRPGKVYDLAIHIMILCFYIFLLWRWDLCHAVAGCQLWANLSSFRASNWSSKRGGLEFVVNSLELFLGDMWKPVKTVGPDFRLKQNVWKTGGEEKHIYRILKVWEKSYCFHFLSTWTFMNAFSRNLNVTLCNHLGIRT